jgi:hypothetical protein
MPTQNNIKSRLTSLIIKIFFSILCIINAQNVSAMPLAPRVSIPLSTEIDHKSDQRHRFSWNSFEQLASSGDSSSDNVIDSGPVQLVARVRRVDRDNRSNGANGLQSDRVRHIVGETQLTMDVTDRAALAFSINADWTRRRLRSVAIDPRKHANIVASAAVGVVDPRGQWSAILRWQGNDIRSNRTDVQRAAAIMGGAMPEGTGWSFEMGTALGIMRAADTRVAIAMTRWTMGEREAGMRGGVGSGQENRILFNVLQRF